MMFLFFKETFLSSIGRKLFFFSLFLAALFVFTPSVLANCSPSLGGNHTVTSNCSFSGLVNGVDNGNFIINSGVVLTINANQTLVFNAGKEIIVNGTIAMSENNAQIKKTNLWIKDADGDGYAINSTDLLAQDTQPTNYQRRSTRVGASDCNDSSATVWQNITGYQDSDLDTYTTGSGQSICSGSSLPSGWRTAANGSDCNDGNASVWQNLTGYLDSDGDGYNRSSGSSICSGASLPPARVNPGSDCDDNNASVWQYLYGYRDIDGDGVRGDNYEGVCTGSSLPGGWSTSSGSDCNDYNASYWYYGTVYYDGDQDGYGSWSTSLCGNGSAWYPYTVNPYDCDDSSSSIYPGAYQYQGCTVYNECSNSCGGSQSRLCQSNGTYAGWSSCGGCTPAACCTNGYLDNDGDGYGAGAYGCYSGGTIVGNNNDCDDGNASIYLGSTRTRYRATAMYPGCGNACVSETQTCGAGGVWSGTYTDTSCTASTRTAYLSSNPCGSCTSETQTCQPSGEWSGSYTNTSCTPQTPLTGYKDADCDTHSVGTYYSNQCPGGCVQPTATGDCDDNNASIYKVGGFLDNDKDGYRSSTWYECVGDDGKTYNFGGDWQLDCNDNNASIGPPISYYRDADGDGYGAGAVQGSACTIPSGYVSNNTDCQDTGTYSQYAYPGAPNFWDETINGSWDWDCDGTLTKEWTGTYYMCSDQPLYRSPRWYYYINAGCPNDCCNGGGATMCESPYIGDRSAYACGATIWIAGGPGNDYYLNSSCTGTIYRWSFSDIQGCK